MDSFRPKFINWLPISLLLIILVGVSLRFFKLGAQSYWLDEGFTVNAIMSLLEKGKTVLDSGFLYRCATYCYPSAWLIKLFGLQGEVAFRLVSAIAGSLMVPLIFLAVRIFFADSPAPRRFTTKVNIMAFIASAFTALSYWQIAWSRQSRWYTVLELFFWLSILFFWRATNNPKHRGLHISLCIIFGLLAAQTNVLAYLLIPIYLIWLVADKLAQRTISWPFVFRILVVIAACLLFIYLIDFFTSNHTLSGYLGGLKFSYSLPYYLSFYLRTYWPFLLVFFLALSFRKNDPMLYQERRSIFFLSLLLVIMFLTVGLFSDVVQYRYLFLVTPAFYLLGSHGIISLWEHIAARWLRMLVIGGFLLACVYTSHLVYWPPGEYYLESDSPLLYNRPYYAFTAQPDFREAYDYLREHSTSDDMIISTSPVFNKIFLGRAGHWLKYHYLGAYDEEDYLFEGRERYVGAEVIADVAQLREIIIRQHGFILLDSLATSQEMLSEEVDFIRSMRLVYSSESNQFSKIWIYQF